MLLISDFLDPGNLKAALRTLVHNRFGVYALHVVDADEETPNLLGDVELTDSETGESLSVSLRGSALEAYRRVFQDHFAELRRFLHSYNGRYIRTLTRTSLEDLFLMTFRREGLFR